MEEMLSTELDRSDWMDFCRVLSFQTEIRSPKSALMAHVLNSSENENCSK